MRHWVEQRWYQANPGALAALTPLEQLFRRQVQRRGRPLRGREFGVPVMVVGNLTVGGSGKSPVVATLARWLQKHGVSVGIVSRGYGGKAPSYPWPVTAQSDPAEAGDEPVMLAQQTGCPVFVAPKRAEAVKALVYAHPVQLILSDDGLQHQALAREIEWVIVDGQRGLGNGHCLPVGPLREPAARLSTVDAVLLNGGRSAACDHPELASALPFSLAISQWRRGDGVVQKSCPFLPGQSVHALAGIGHPQRFFDQLTQLGLAVTPHPKADHAVLTQADLQAEPELPWIMTAKDAVKLRHQLNAQHWVMDIEAVLPETLMTALSQQLQQLGVSLHWGRSDEHTGPHPAE